MYWYPNQFPELKGKGYKARALIVFPFHMKYPRIGMFYLLGVISALVATTAVMVNLPTGNVCGALAWGVGLAIWQVEYLIILNRVEYPLLKEFLSNARQSPQ